MTLRLPMVLGNLTVPCPNCNQDTFWGLLGEEGTSDCNQFVITLRPVLAQPHHCPSRDYSPESEEA